MYPMVKAPPWFGGQMGVPGSDTPLGFRLLPQGVVFYVDPTHPDSLDANDGTDPMGPKKTINSALTAAVSGRGDVIVIMPETYAEDLVVTKNYITLIGALSSGYGRPDIVGDAAEAIAIHAQGFRAERCRFAAATGFSAVHQQGNGFLFNDCVFDGDGAYDFHLLPDLNDDSYTASEGKILNSLFRYGTHGLAFANPGTGVEGGVGSTDNLIQGCRFSQHITASIQDFMTGVPGVDWSLHDTFIDSCLFVETGALFLYIDLSDGALNTGMVSNCCFADADITGAQVVLPAGVFSINNHDGTYAAVP